MLLIVAILVVVICVGTLVLCSPVVVEALPCSMTSTRMRMMTMHLHGSKVLAEIPADVDPEMARAMQTFPQWTQEEIQGYFDQGGPLNPSKTGSTIGEAA